jgi:hypothetical protein
MTTQGDGSRGRIGAILRDVQFWIHANWGWAVALVVVMLGVGALCGSALWRTTRFS